VQDLIVGRYSLRFDVRFGSTESLSGLRAPLLLQCRQLALHFDIAVGTENHREGFSGPLDQEFLSPKLRGFQEL
jgi:hypothetical protein